MSREIRRIPVGFEWPTWTVQRLVAPIGYAEDGFPPSGPKMPDDVYSGRVHIERGSTMQWKDTEIPMYDRPLSAELAEWDAYAAEHGDQEALEYHGPRPGSTECDPEQSDTVRRLWVEVGGCPTLFGRQENGPLVPYYCYQPEGWPPVDERGYCYVSTVTEGSPISPVLPTRDDLRAWLMEHQSFSADAVDRFLETGYSFGSMVSIRDGDDVKVVSGVEALSDDPRSVDETGF